MRIASAYKAGIPKHSMPALTGKADIVRICHLTSAFLWPPHQLESCFDMPPRLSLFAISPFFE